MCGAFVLHLPSWDVVTSHVYNTPFHISHTQWQTMRDMKSNKQPARVVVHFRIFLDPAVHIATQRAYWGNFRHAIVPSALYLSALQHLDRRKVFFARNEGRKQSASVLSLCCSSRFEVCIECNQPLAHRDRAWQFRIWQFEI